MIEAVITCMALNIYHEARNENAKAQAAVAHVVLNRVRNDKYPDDACAVIYQSRGKHKCQFSWYCDGKSDRAYEKLAYKKAEYIAFNVIKGNIPDPTHGATHYHADYVSPYWTRAGTHTVSIGLHHFYKLP